MTGRGVRCHFGDGDVPGVMSGSHMTVTRVTETGKHSVTVPAHRELRIGTLNAIVNEVAEVAGLSRRAVREALFG